MLDVGEVSRQLHSSDGDLGDGQTESERLLDELDLVREPGVLRREDM